jgi:hypothetical protein
MDRSNVTCRSGAVPGTTLAASGEDQQVAHLPGQSRQNGQKEEQLKPQKLNSVHRPTLAAPSTAHEWEQIKEDAH